MENKEKQIEEMTKDIHRVCTYCSGEMFDEYTCDRCQAKLLIEKGYQKIDKDSVVLSREEQEIRANELIETLKAVKNQASKETAREILQWLKDHCAFAGWVFVETYFREQFSVEIKE